MQRWIDVGFTPAQAELLSELVTRDYLREEFRRFKREILFWMVGMFMPVYATLIYLLFKVG
jgi:hypothetical protein